MACSTPTFGAGMELLMIVLGWMALMVVAAAAMSAFGRASGRADEAVDAMIARATRDEQVEVALAARSGSRTEVLR